MFDSDVVDTKFPDDTPRQDLEDDGSAVHSSMRHVHPLMLTAANKPSVWDWRYHFAKEILLGISKALCSARPKEYSEILELDRRIRDFEVHPYLLRPPPEDKLGCDPDFHRLHPLYAASQKEWGGTFSSFFYMVV